MAQLGKYDPSLESADAGERTFEKVRTLRTARPDSLLMLLLTAEPCLHPVHAHA